jgi:hypothetical protein
MEEELKRSHLRGRFLQLLLSLLLLLLLHPFLENLSTAKILLDIFLTCTLLSALYSVSENKRRLKWASLLFLAAMVGVWLGYIVKENPVVAASPLMVTFFFAFVAVRILSYVLRAQEVTAEMIYGALSVYLVMGLIWAMVYAALEQTQPGSLQIGADQPLTQQCVYYSYVTLTTLGYGDVTPLSGPARSFSYVEALTGQLYLAVLIARLVGLHIAHSGKK